MIQIRVDATAALAGLKDTQLRQVPFALALTLNQLANDGQAAERERIKGAFKLRRETFNLRGVYIANQDRATKKRLAVVIQVEAKRGYLEKFEQGGDKVPVNGRRMLAVPNSKIFGKRILKPDDPLRPKNLHLHKDAHGRVIGDQRSFVIKLQNGQQAIMQRTDRKLMTTGSGGLSRVRLDNFQGGMGPRRRWEKYSFHRSKGTRLLYNLVRRVKVPAQLQFIETITKAVDAQASMRFDEAFAKAMKGAR